MTALRTQQQRKKETYRRDRFPFLLLLSLLIHAVLILLLALFFAKRAGQKPTPPPETPAPEVTLEIPPPSRERPFIEAKEVADKAPENSPFQSDQNTKAASELPPEGSLPLPSQQGVSQAAMELQNQRYTQGERPASSAGNPAPPSPASPPSPQQPSQKQEQQPQATPTHLPTPAPTATPQSTATPQPTPSTPSPPNSIKLLDLPKAQPTPTHPVSPGTTTPPTPQPASPPSAPGTQGTRKGYQPETRQTVIRGNISNRGRSSVAAEATPIGRYKKAVADAIGSRWYYYVNERMGLISIGSVSVSFKVTAAGKVTDLHVGSSNGNQSLTDCSLRSIMDAKLPPIPPEVVPTLQNGCLEIDYNFTIY